MTVLDALGKPAEVGQRVAFGEANKGAHALRIGRIVKINPKTVEIEHTVEVSRWERQHYPTGFKQEVSRRSASAYVVVPHD